MAIIDNIRDRVALELGLQIMERCQKELELNHALEELASLRAAERHSQVAPAPGPQGETSEA